MRINTVREQSGSCSCCARTCSGHVLVDVNSLPTAASVLALVAGGQSVRLPWHRREVVGSWGIKQLQGLPSIRGELVLPGHSTHLLTPGR